MPARRPPIGFAGLTGNNIGWATPIWATEIGNGGLELRHRQQTWAAEIGNTNFGFRELGQQQQLRVLQLG
jgi:hypothetical protein